MVTLEFILPLYSIVRYLHRKLETQVLKAAKAFPAVVLTGPRRAGKTWLLRHLLPEADYYLLEDPTVLARLRADPQGFLDGLRLPVILDEVQNAPEVFALVRARLDARPRRTGQWFLTGSQEAPLMREVSESMAGRAAVLQLLPFSAREHPKVSMLRGGYPEALARPSAAPLWFASYVQTYLERDVRAVTAVKDLAAFRSFLALVGSRHGQVQNKTDLAAPLGVSVPTITQWLAVLETTALFFPRNGDHRCRWNCCRHHRRMQGRDGHCLTNDREMTMQEVVFFAKCLQ